MLNIKTEEPKAKQLPKVKSNVAVILATEKRENRTAKVFNHPDNILEIYIDKELKGATNARNKALKMMHEKGYTKFWMIDDDLTGVRHHNKTQKEGVRLEDIEFPGNTAIGTVFIAGLLFPSNWERHYVQKVGECFYLLNYEIMPKDINFPEGIIWENYIIQLNAWLLGFNVWKTTEWGFADKNLDLKSSLESSNEKSILRNRHLVEVYTPFVEHLIKKGVKPEDFNERIKCVAQMSPRFLKTDAERIYWCKKILGRDPIILNPDRTF